jgi:Trypsin-like peptidase domain
VAAAVIATAVIGATATTGVLQTVYPGGVTQWAADLTGPARLSDLDLQSSVRRSLLTTIAPEWHQTLASQGSAFFFADESEVVTAAHVLPSPLVQLSLIDGLGVSHSANLMSKDPAYDVAVMRVDGMSVIPLQPAIHPVYPGSKVYMAGNPGGSAPDTLVSGHVVTSSYNTTVEGLDVTGAILVNGGPAGPGMSGGPVVDEWGKVIGMVEGGTSDGIHVVVIPLSTISREVADTNLAGTPMYIGPPLITRPSSQLVLDTSYFAGRGASQNGNDVHYQVRSQNGSYYAGDLWVGTQATIAAAASDVTNCQSHLGTGWPRITNDPWSIGDGGRIIGAADYTGQIVLMACWSERNAEAIWWVVTRNYDDSKFFQSIATQQELKLYAA